MTIFPLVPSFISALDQSFLTLVEESYPAVLAFCFLNEIQREFLSSYQHEKVQATQRPYTFMQFGQSFTVINRKISFSTIITIFTIHMLIGHTLPRACIKLKDILTRVPGFLYMSRVYIYISFLPIIIVIFLVSPTVISQIIAKIHNPMSNFL